MPQTTPRLQVLETVTLSDDWGRLAKTRFRLRMADGRVEEMWRETYDRGDGVAILPHDPERGTVLLGRQFRWPAAHAGVDPPDLVEAAAGLLDGDDPARAIRREAREELGLDIGAPRHLFTLFSSPGSITERMHYYVAAYCAADARATIAGLPHEGEEIAVLEMSLQAALAMVADGRICDAKTVILLQYAALHLSLGRAP